MTNFNDFKLTFANMVKLPMFEIEVINLEYNTKEFLLFNIELNGNSLMAFHEPLNMFEVESSKTPVTVWECDSDFSLDSNLETLHELCINEIIDSEFYHLV